MSSLIRSDFRLIDELFEFIRGRGCVLDFSDVTFSEFFENNLKINIDDNIYAENGTSKGKRLRTFLAKVDNINAIRALEALWAHRVDCLARAGINDPVANAEGRYLTLLQRLNSSGPAGGEPPRHVCDRAKLDGLRMELYNLRELPAQRRGYAFEDFLTRVFRENKLEPRQPFRSLGEQIDGSFILDSEIYRLKRNGRNIKLPPLISTPSMENLIRWLGHGEYLLAIANFLQRGFPRSGAHSGFFAWKGKTFTMLSTVKFRLSIYCDQKFDVRLKPYNRLRHWQISFRKSRPSISVVCIN